MPTIIFLSKANLRVEDENQVSSPKSHWNIWIVGNLKHHLFHCKWVNYCTHLMDGVKKNVLNSVTHLNMTCVKCGSKSGHQNDLVCLQEIELHALNLSTIVSSIINIIEGGYLIIIWLQHICLCKIIATIWKLVKLYKSLLNSNIKFVDPKNIPNYEFHVENQCGKQQKLTI